MDFDHAFHSDVIMTLMYSKNNGTCQSHYHCVRYLGQNEGTIIVVHVAKLLCFSMKYNLTLKLQI